MRALDSFPKVDGELLERTRRGGVVTVAVALFIAVLVLSETWAYAFAPWTQHFVVDPAIPHAIERKAMESAWQMEGHRGRAPVGAARIPLVIDVSVATPCGSLVVVLTEADGSRVVVNELFSFEDESSPGWLRDAPAATQSGPSCRLQGAVPVERVRGSLSLRPILSEAGGALGVLAAAMDEHVNFAHHIHGVAFGVAELEAAGWDLRRGPLAGACQHALAAHVSWAYFLSVIPVYNAAPGVWRGCPRAGGLRENRYAVGSYGGRAGLHPGLVVHFDFEPVALVLASGRPPFGAFAARLAGIVGGVYAAALVFLRLCGAITWVFKRRRGNSNRSLTKTPSTQMLSRL